MPKLVSLEVATFQVCLAGERDHWLMQHAPTRWKATESEVWETFFVMDYEFDNDFSHPWIN